VSTRHIRKNDTVIAVRGVNAGKTGKVLQVMPSRNRAIVEGLNLVKKSMRKSQDNPQGAIVEREGTLHLSNLMLYCPDCKKGVRTGRVKESGKMLRRCRRCNRVFDN
jgi:large subunit ribosomal protein L24